MNTALSAADWRNENTFCILSYATELVRFKIHNQRNTQFLEYEVTEHISK